MRPFVSFLAASIPSPSRTLRNRARRLWETVRFRGGGHPGPYGVADAAVWASSHKDLATVTHLAEPRVQPVSSRPIVMAGPHRDADRDPYFRRQVSLRENVQAQTLVVAQDCRIAGMGGSVISPDNLLLCDCSGLGQIKMEEVSGYDAESKRRCGKSLTYIVGASKVVGRGPLPPPETINGTVAVIASRKCENFYHWMIEAIPRLRLVEASGQRPDYYYVPTHARHHRDALDLLGITSDRRISAAPGTHVRARQTLLPSDPPNVVTPEACDYLRHALLPAALERSPAAASLPRLFISRRNARWRTIVNESELSVLLEARGFTTIVLEEYALSDQIRLFHNAEIVVAPHGAGLANLVFSRAGTSVLEIGSTFRPHDCFWQIAHLRRLNYIVLFAENDHATSKPGHDAHLVVNLRELESALDELESRAMSRAGDAQ